MAEEREVIEAEIRSAFDARDHERSASLAIEHYGGELLSFLTANMRRSDEANEAFGSFCEMFWTTWPSFEWRCSARTWAYTLARRSMSQYRRRERKHGAASPLTQLSQLSAAVDRVRTATAAYQRTAVKSRFQEVREQLPPDDQTLLILRVDRGLSWLELAEVMLGDDVVPSAEALKTEAARLRKRFQLAKDRLKAMMQEAGLLDQD